MKLFTAPWCTNCTPVKDYILENELDVELIDVDTSEGKAMIQERGIRSIPVLEASPKNFHIGPDNIINYLKETL